MVFISNISKYSKSAIFYLILLLIIFYSIILYIDGRVYKLKNEVLKIHLSNTKNENLNFSIDKCEAKENYLEITGWSYKIHEKITNPYSFYVLHNGVDYFKLKTTYCDRSDVQSLYSNESNITFSGMISKIDINKIRKGQYSLYIYYKTNGNNILINTNKTIKL